MKIFQSTLMTLMILLLLSFPGSFAHTSSGLTDQDDAVRAYQQAYNLVLEQNWDAASDAFNRYLRNYPEGRHRDAAGFWVCYASYQLEGPGSEAFACFDDFLESHPRSRWAEDARSNLVRIATKMADAGDDSYMARVQRYKESADEMVIMSAVQALTGRMTSGDVAFLTDVYYRHDSQRLRTQILHALASVDLPEARNFLFDIVRSGTESHEINIAIQALLSNGDENVILEILDLYDDLNERNQRVVLGMVSSMHQRGDRVFEFMLDRVDSEENPQTIAFILNNLISAFPDRPETIEALIRAFESVENHSVRIIVFQHLELLPLEEQKRIMQATFSSENRFLIQFAAQKALKSEHPEIRNMMRDKIHKDQNTALLVPLIAGMPESISEEERSRLFEIILHHSSSQAAGIALQKWMETGQPETDQIRRIISESNNWHIHSYKLFDAIATDSDFEWFSDYFKTIPESEIRRQILFSITRSGKEQNALIGFLSDVARTDPSGRVRSTAVSVLGTLDSDHAREALKQVLEGS